MSKRAPCADYIAFIDLRIPNGFARHARSVAHAMHSNGVKTTLLSFDSNANALPAGVGRLFFLALQRIFKGRGFVVLSTQANYLQIFLAAAAKIAGRPLIYDMQDLTPESFLHLYHTVLPRPLRLIFAAWLRFSERVICKLSDTVLVVSPGMKKILSTRVRHSEKLILFPNCHSFEKLPSTVRSSLPTLVYAGGLQPRYRGIETQIQALSGLPDWRILIAGEGDESWIADFSREHNVEGQVELRGFISPSEVREMLAASHVLVIEGVEYGLPSKFFEAVGAGVIVVSPQTACDVNMILGSSALVFDGSAESLQRTLQNAWENKDRLPDRQHDRLSAFLDETSREAARFTSYLLETLSARSPAQPPLRQKDSS